MINRLHLSITRAFREQSENVNFLKKKMQPGYLVDEKRDRICNTPKVRFQETIKGQDDSKSVVCMSPWSKKKH